MSDKDRLDFIERMLIKDGIGHGAGVSIRMNTLISSQPGMRNVPVQIFTVPSQHQYGRTVREVIDVAMEFESGERDWAKENWQKIATK